MSQQQILIDQIYNDIQNGKSISDLSAQQRDAVFTVIEGLDKGEMRVCQKVEKEWQTHQWIKKAILLYFRLQKMTVMQAGDFQYFDKVPVKKWSEADGVRVVPHALARKGSFINKGAILMPSYVNIGAYVDSGTMVDTWATVGSCAQIGKNVHLSGGVGIGGVLEPVQANPVIIEDDCFLGSRAIVVEGVLVEEGAVLGAGVTITASTKIIDVTGPEAKEYKGRVPARSVVIPGTVNKKFASGDYGVPCCLIIGQRKPSTDLKTSLTEALRDYQVSV
ncbi:MAG: 2,3,4,5-tetrahydropyridine-2,6-dicarboxylate N-succinyltransferase [Pseudobdellovibrionaceae bacterium]